MLSYLFAQECWPYLEITVAMLPDAHTNGPLGPVLIWAECCDVISGILGSPQTYSAHLLPDTWHFLTRNTSFHATVRERERQRENSNYHRILSREVVCYWLTCIFIFSKLMLLSHFSRVQLCATPWTAAYQAPLSMGFSKQEYWSGVPLYLIFKNTISTKKLVRKYSYCSTPP